MTVAHSTMTHSTLPHQTIAHRQQPTMTIAHQTITHSDNCPLDNRPPRQQLTGQSPTRQLLTRQSPIRHQLTRQLVTRQLATASVKTKLFQLLTILGGHIFRTCRGIVDWRPRLNIVSKGGFKVGKDQINLLQTNNRFFENVGAINFLEKK